MGGAWYSYAFVLELKTNVFVSIEGTPKAWCEPGGDCGICGASTSWVLVCKPLSLSLGRRQYALAPELGDIMRGSMDIVSISGLGGRGAELLLVFERERDRASSVILMVRFRRRMMQNAIKRMRRRRKAAPPIIPPIMGLLRPDEPGVEEAEVLGIADVLEGSETLGTIPPESEGVNVGAPRIVEEVRVVVDVVVYPLISVVVNVSVSVKGTGVVV